jgi:hypothetical protein
MLAKLQSYYTLVVPDREVTHIDEFITHMLAVLRNY